MRNEGSLAAKPPKSRKGALLIGIGIGLVAGYCLAWLTFLVVVSSGG